MEHNNSTNIVKTFKSSIQEMFHSKKLVCVDISHYDFMQAAHYISNIRDNNIIVLMSSNKEFCKFVNDGSDMKTNKKIRVKNDPVFCAFYKDNVIYLYEEDVSFTQSFIAKNLFGDDKDDTCAVCFLGKKTDSSYFTCPCGNFVCMTCIEKQLDHSITAYKCPKCANSIGITTTIA